MEVNEVYKRAVQGLRSDLRELETEEAKLASRLKEIKRRKEKIAETLSNLSFLLGEETSEGLTDAVRNLFASRPEVWAQARDVRDGLQKRGVQIDNYAQPLATIHTTLRRLKKRGELESKKNSQGKIIYHWAGEDEDEK